MEGKERKGKEKKEKEDEAFDSLLGMDVIKLFRQTDRQAGAENWSLANFIRTLAGFELEGEII